MKKRKYPALGIPFKAEMVRAILAGKKTQTRRIMKTQPVEVDEYEGVALLFATDDENAKEHLIGDKPFKPKYQLGEILYVKETWRWYYPVDEYDRVDRDSPIIEYAADGLEDIYFMDDDGGIETDKNGAQRFVPLRPSQYMPYDVARIFLKVTDIRVERLNDISCEDSIAEGIEFKNPYYRDYLDPRTDGFLDTIQTQWPKEEQKYYAEQASYRTLWESINGPGSWQANPWVWVYTFEPAKKPV